MSYSYLIEFSPDGTLTEHEFQNSYGSAPYIWACVSQRYWGNHVNWVIGLDSQKEKDKFWGIAIQDDVPNFIKIAHGSTFNRRLIKQENFSRLADAFTDLVNHFHFPNRVCHLGEMANIIRKSEALFIGFHWTSSGDNPWIIREDKDTEDDDENEPIYRPYNPLKESNHKFLFDLWERKTT